MKTFIKNQIDFKCHSYGNSEVSSSFSQSNTVDASYKLLYIYDGGCTIVIDKKPHTASRGDSVLIFPCLSFEIKPEPDLKYTWLEFSGFESAAILGRVAFSKKNPVLGKMDIDGFEDLFEMPANLDTAYSHYRMGGCFLLLLSYYIEKFPSKTNENEGYVYRACTYIDNNFSTPGFGVKNVTEALKIDRSYLYRLFMDEMGVSIIDYIIRRRISKAEIMLANSGLSVKDVAYSVGFSDQMYFSRVFKRINGKTPSEFRATLGLKN